MNFIGTPNAITKPAVNLNGVPVSFVNVHHEVGAISTCDVGVRAEDLGLFNVPDTLGTVSMDSGDTLFFGYISGIGYTNMRGGLTPTVSLIHGARDLDETTSLIPGLMPGSTSDVGTVLYSGGSSVGGSIDLSNINRLNIDVSQPFDSALCNGLAKLIDRTAPQSQILQLLASQAGQKQKAIAMLTQIGTGTNTGVIAFSKSQSIPNMIVFILKT